MGNAALASYPARTRALARKALCLFASVALAAGLLPALSFADELVTHDDASVTVVGEAYKGNATVYDNAFGAEAKNKNAALDELCNLTFVGPYRFNVAGNTVVRGKYDTQARLETAVHSDPDAESKLPALQNSGSIKVGGFDGTAPRTNSSSAVLAQPSGGSTDNVVAAYLVVAATQHASFRSGASGANYPLSNYGVGIKGPAGAIRHYYPQYLFIDNPNFARVSCFFDVTDFVKNQGYGTYTGINIPSTPMGDDKSGSDYFGAWKLIVVERDAGLPVRMVRLMLGGTSVVRGGAASAVISGNGLSIASNPTGEVVVSMDGTDIDSNQSLNLAAGTGGSPAKVRYLAEDGTTLFPADHFFRFRIFNKDADVQTSPGASSTGAAYAPFPAGTPIYNTDLSLVDLNRLRFGDASDNKVLAGGENGVKATVSTSDAPTLLSALGLAADILVPEFQTTFAITNLTQHYSTADAGFSLAADYAREGDRLKATVRSVNVSKADSYLGLEKASVSIKAPAFAHIFNSVAEGAEITARYYSGYNSEADFSLLVAQVTDDTIVLETPDDATLSKIKPGGYFEVIFEGTAKGSQDYREYVN